MSTGGGARRTPPQAWSLPSPLAPRFGLTAWVVLATAMGLVEVVAGHVLDPVPQPGSPCWPVWLGVWGRGPLALPDPGDPAWPRRYLALWRAYPECFATPYPDLPLGRAQYLAAVVLLVASLAAYAAWPRWRIIRYGLLPADSLPDVGARLRELRRLTGARVRFLADLHSPRATGLAFGRLGRRYVLVNRGLIALRRRDPAIFDAIVLHELAHVRNRDVDVAYLTVLQWRTFVAVFFVPVLLLFNDALDRADGSDNSGHLGVLFQVGLLAVAVLLTHHAVLREREWEADARAAHWANDQAALRRVFAGPVDAAARAGVAEREDRGWPRRLAHRLFRLHPDPDERAAALTDPRSWLSPSPVQAGVVGLTVGLTWVPALAVFAEVLRDLGAARGPVRYLPGLAVPALAPVAILLGLTVGAAIWRGVSCLGAGAATWVRVNLVGLALGGGLAAGELLTAQRSPLGPAVAGALAANALPPAVRLTHAAALVTLGWLLALWLAGCAATWRAAVVRSPRPGLLARLGVALGALPLLAVLPLLLGLRLTPVTHDRYASVGSYLGYLVDGFAAAGPYPWLGLAAVLAGVPAAGALAGGFTGARVRRSAATGRSG